MEPPELAPRVYRWSPPRVREHACSASAASTLTLTWTRARTLTTGLQHKRGLDTQIQYNRGLKMGVEDMTLEEKKARATLALYHYH